MLLPGCGAMVLLLTTEQELAITNMDQGTIRQRPQLPLTPTLQQILLALTQVGRHLKLGSAYLCSHVSLGAARADISLVDGAAGGRRTLYLSAQRLFRALLLADGRQYDRLLRGFRLVNFLVREELILHLVSVNVG